MLYLICKGETVSRKLEYQKIIDQAIARGSIFVSMDETDFNFDFLKLASSGSTLFSDSYVVLCNDVLSSQDLNTETITGMLSDLKTSTHTFIFNERTIVKDNIKYFEKAGVTIVSCEDKQKKEKARPSLFAITDSFGARDRKMSWLLLTNATSRGVAPEEIQGLLFWIVKAMMLSHKESNLSQSETALNPFVYQKAKRFSGSFKYNELENMSRDLVKIYHRAHLGEIDFATGLELFLLKSL